MSDPDEPITQRPALCPACALRKHHDATRAVGGPPGTRQRCPSCRCVWSEAGRTGDGSRQVLVHRPAVIP